MCAIAGRFNFRSGAPVDASTLDRMCALLAHRGPDGTGVHCSGAIGLAHTRLAVLDPTSAGAQPMEAFGLRITYNGEIYNFRELRAELEREGHRFRTQTDTEVILCAYRQWGPACLPRFMGMFAFAIWDSTTRTLFAARDRLGQKPFCYRLDRDGFVWASEPKAFLAEHAFAVTPDARALAHYLALLYVPGSQSVFEGVTRLPPAHSLTIRDQTLTTARYWRPSFARKTVLSEQAAGHELRARLTTAVTRRLVSDVPVGAFLSGGIDSGLVVALMAEGRSQQVRTFSIGFTEERYNELASARTVAQRYRTDHQEFVVRPDAIEILPHLIWHYNEPYADSSAIPTWYLSRLTSQAVKVALNGDGGDELLAGYDRYRAMMLADTVGRAPASFGRILAALGTRLPRGSRHPRFARAARFLESMTGPRADRYARWMTHIDEDLVHRLCTDEFISAAGRVDPADYFQARFEESDATDTLDATLDVDLHTYLPDDLLVKVDIASMAHGLEARSPFLDHELVEFAASLPPSLKRRGRVSKYLLRAVARPLLPPAIMRQPKKGFGVPLDLWFRHELRDFVRDILMSTRARQRGYFRPRGIEALIDEHMSGRRNRHQLLWALLVFELWHRMFVDATRPEPPGPTHRAGPAGG